MHDNPLVPLIPYAGTSFWRPAATGNVKGFADITRDEEDSDDDEEGNEYYAGGEKSGQVTAELQLEVCMTMVLSRLILAECFICSSMW